MNDREDYDYFVEKCDELEKRVAALEGDRRLLVDTLLEASQFIANNTPGYRDHPESNWGLARIRGVLARLTP